jgi:hypothetical protein
MIKPVLLPAEAVLRAIIEDEVKCYPYVTIKIKKLKTCYKVTIDDGDDDVTGKVAKIKDAYTLCNEFHDWKLADEPSN